MSSVTKRPHQQAFTQYDEAGLVVEVPTKHRRCSECGATSTPQWRQGPSGPQTLCNACGVRYSRLTRRVKMPKRQHSEFSSQDDMQDVMHDSGSEDTSKGTTILMTAPSTPALGTAACAPAVQLSPMSALTTQHTYPAGSPIRLARAVRTSSNLFNIAPCSPAGMATPPAGTNNSRRSSTGGSSVPFKAELPVPIKAEVHLLAKASVLDSPRRKARFMEKPPHEDEDLDCQAALNLLSMAAGPPCREGGSPRTPHVGSSPAGPTSPFGGLAAAVQHQAIRAEDAGLSRQPSSASAATIASPPAVSPAEVKALQQLCAAFDQRFKDLVAARAACEAVSRVLLVKQEEARAAQHAARQAAKALMLHAQDLSCHEDVVKAISHASVLARQQDDQQPLLQPEHEAAQEATIITDVQPHSVNSSSSSTPVLGQVLPEPTMDMAASQ